MWIRLSLYRRTPSFHSLYGLLWWTALSEVESEEGTLSFVRSQTTKEQ